MGEQKYKNPLHEMASTTITEYWNDSCSVSELQYAIENGAVGATTNPVIVAAVLKKDMPLYKDRIIELIKEMPTATEDDIAWKMIEEMAVKGAELLKPVFDKSNGQKGRISIQTNPKYYRNADLMIKQAVYFNTLAPNMQIKIPTTKAGIEAIEEVTYQGVNINATVSFTVPQALAVAEAVERGFRRREKEGKDISKIHSVCTIMVGRTDDWLKEVAQRDNIIIDPECLEWAGIATMKKAYGIYKERGYRIRLLAAAYRNHLQWSEFIGGDLVETIPYKWQKIFNSSDIKVHNRINNTVDSKIIEQLSKHFVDFNKAYNEDGMTVEQFDTYGAVNKTLLSFLSGYDDLIKIIREIMIIVR